MCIFLFHAPPPSGGGWGRGGKNMSFIKGLAGKMGQGIGLRKGKKGEIGEEGREKKGEGKKEEKQEICF